MLHLTAFDKGDLATVSAQVQDAVLKLGDVSWNPQRRTFALVANRFAWDALPDKQRRRTGLRFNYVSAARRHLPANAGADLVLALLAITFEPSRTKDKLSGTVTLNFSGGHAIALDVEVIDVQLDDLGAAWSASSEPGHGA
jgi:Protein of unknown function (DUF2948)